MSGKLTDAQMRALRTVLMWSESDGTYMPFASEARSFEAAARKGYLEYRSVSRGSRRNGYALTPAGRSALEQTPPPSGDGQ